MMASACVNNAGMSPELFLDFEFCLFDPVNNGWLNPRISFSRDLADDAPLRMSSEKLEAETSDLEVASKDLADFKFYLFDLRHFLHRSTSKNPKSSSTDSSLSLPLLRNSSDSDDAPPRISSEKLEAETPDPEAVGKDLADFKFRLFDLRHFHHRSTFKNPKSSSTDSSLSLPLLHNSFDIESVSISHLSLFSSSSSCPNHEDLLRLSLDAGPISDGISNSGRLEWAQVGLRPEFSKKFRA